MILFDTNVCAPTRPIAPTRSERAVGRSTYSALSGSGWQRAAGPLLSDAVLAALALEYGAVLASTDNDFRRFPTLRWINPLEAL